MARPITVVEVEPFPSRAGDVWSEDERLEFVDFIARNPRAGDRIPGTGGVRKVRWSRGAKGKRAGVRVVYYFFHEAAPIFLLTVYSKGATRDLSAQDRKNVGRIAAAIRSRYGRSWI